MSAPTPHYLLFSEADRPCDSGRWRFVLRTVDGSTNLEVADVEPAARGARLDLLTVVRALEALDQPSRVTMVGCSPYVRRGVQYGLSEWRSNGWRWEFFGHMVPVKNVDLWQRMDRALRFHRVECRQRRFDPPHQPPGKGARSLVGGALERRFRQHVAAAFFRRDARDGGITVVGIRVPSRRQLRYRMSSILAKCRRRPAALARLWRRRVMRSWTAPAVCARAE